MNNKETKKDLSNMDNKTTILIENVLDSWYTILGLEEYPIKINNEYDELIDVPFNQLFKNDINVVHQAIMRYIDLIKNNGQLNKFIEDKIRTKWSNEHLEELYNDFYLIPKT